MDDISDFTEAEFISFVKNIRIVNKGGTDDELGELLEKFSRLAGHPDGYDLIFHPELGADNSAEGVTKTVKEWRKAQGLPGFKND
ncbi:MULTISPECIES: bacteriocin immunity protein [Pseudomonas]|uniref:bacteriocin immunity protein n=1 Tax=Pseudomonas TaxID=286 RepID=UPI000F483488|nr:bacteriocin immunity protein [Pseudomonas protegens]ROL92161.1 bacteriocin immunity protein [Pseudomonas protegens]ROM03482.1 bacteriocin immunity protein [Pseudomonas protegens]ROM06278.1 bacteriocin immunity protein [Pseudomonas protegens]ROM14678.1 bacteriocin immunity protein [Pseudomonas protegens]